MKKTIKDLQVEIETIKKMQNERKLETKIQELKQEHKANFINKV